MSELVYDNGKVRVVAGRLVHVSVVGIGPVISITYEELADIAEAVAAYLEETRSRGTSNG